MHPSVRRRVRILDDYTTALTQFRDAEERLITAQRALDEFIAQAKRRRRNPPPCGTESGYARHVRGTQTVPRSLPCEPCLYAHARAERDRAMRRRVAGWRPTDERRTA